jgi:hypothetical protein
LILTSCITPQEYEATRPWPRCHGSRKPGLHVCEFSGLQVAHLEQQAIPRAAISYCRILMQVPAFKPPVCSRVTNTSDNIKEVPSRLLSYAISQFGTVAALNQDCSAIHHHHLPGAKSFLH